jgi:hypothetical protein
MADAHLDALSCAGLPEVRQRGTPDCRAGGAATHPGSV